MRKLILLPILVFAASMPSAAQQEHALACLVLLQGNGSVFGILSDVSGHRYIIIDEIIDRGPCGYMQFVIFGSRKAEALLPAWLSLKQADHEHLKRLVRSTAFISDNDPADLDKAFKKALLAISLRPSESKPIILLFSDGIFSSGSKRAFFQRTFPRLIRTSLPVVVFKLTGFDTPELLNLAKETDGVLFPGSRDIVEVVLAALKNYAPNFASPPPAPRPDPAKIVLTLEGPDRLGEEEELTVSAAIFYDGQPVIGGEKVVDDWVILIGSVTLYLNNSVPFEMRPDEQRYVVRAGKLSTGQHRLEIVVSGRFVGPYGPQAFTRSLSKTIEVYKPMPLIALQASKHQITRNEPVILKAVVLRGTVTGKAIGLLAIADNTKIPIVLHRVNHNEFKGVARLSPTGVYTLRPADFTLERQLTLTVTRPLLHIRPMEIFVAGAALTKGLDITLESELYGPDIARIAISSDCQGRAELRTEPTKVELSSARPKAVVKLLTSRINFWAKVLQRKISCQIEVKDMSGLLAPVVVTAIVQPPIPVSIYVGAIAFIGGLAIAGISWRWRARRMTSSQLLPGQEFTFAKPTDGTILEVAVGRAPKGLHKIVIPREDVAETQFVIRVENGVCKLVPKSRLKTYVDKVAALAETILSNNSIIEFGQGASCSLLFKQDEQQIRLKVIK